MMRRYTLLRHLDARWFLPFLAFIFAGGLWVVDAFIDSIFYRQQAFLDLLIYDIPAHDLTVRITITIGLILGGYFVGLLLHRTHVKEREYQSLLNTTQDAVWIVGPEGYLEDVNLAACHLLGYDRVDLLGQHISRIDATENPDYTKRHIAQVQHQGSDRFQTVHRTKSGDILDVEVTTTAIDQETGRLAAFIRDVTPQKTTVRQLKAKEARQAKQLAQFQQMLDPLLKESRSWISNNGSLI